MSSKALDAIGGNETRVVRPENVEKYAQNGKKADGEEVKVENDLQKKYEAVSKNGDTLELSETGKKMGTHEEKDTVSAVKQVISDTGQKISDSTLSKYSESKLRQMYAQKKITKQQYEKAMKNRTKSRRI